MFGRPRVHSVLKLDKGKYGSRKPTEREETGRMNNPRMSVIGLTVATKYWAAGATNSLKTTTLGIYSPSLFATTPAFDFLGPSSTKRLIKQCTVVFVRENAKYKHQ